MARKQKKIKVLWLGDAVTPTGFARVNHSIQQNLPKYKYDLHQLGINYYGDPHDFPVKIYPASLKGHVYGFNRIKEFVDKDFDLIFILNDLWIINEYLKEIKQAFGSKIPKIVTYMPMDSTMPDRSWFEHFDIVDRVCVYTQFGYDTVRDVNPDIDLSIVPHGIDNSTFYKFNKPKMECKMGVFPAEKSFLESWIVLNANRNQPRKRNDIAFEGFAQFAQDKPKNVKYYHHAGIEDVGWDILRLSNKLGKKYDFNLEERLIVTNMNRNVQSVTDEQLNTIYNASDVGLNASLGEGWGLTNVEHAMTGSAQVVPNHSACRELFHDVGRLIETSQELCFEKTLTYGRLVTPEAIAEQLQFLYDNPEEKARLEEAALAKFTAPEYSWKNVANTWHRIFREIL